MALLSGYRIGPLAVALVAVVTSIVTTLATLGISFAYFEFNKSGPIPLAPTAALIAPGSQPIQCGAQVYSPVQNSCVDQSVFDDEMKRLFTALGIDPSIYQRNGN